MERPRWPTRPGGAAASLVICHNDVCLENVVFRDGVAVGLLDFDFAAPGRRVYDLSQFARMCVPIDDESRVASVGGRRTSRSDSASWPTRTGCRPGREFFDALAERIAHGGEFLRRRVEAGDENFVELWESMGGMARFDRRREWWAGASAGFAARARLTARRFGSLASPPP